MDILYNNSLILRNYDIYYIKINFIVFFQKLLGN